MNESALYLMAYLTTLTQTAILSAVGSVKEQSSAVGCVKEQTRAEICVKEKYSADLFMCQHVYVSIC